MKEIMKNAMRHCLALLVVLCLFAAALSGLAEENFTLAGSAYGVSAAEEIGMGPALDLLAENAAAAGAQPSVRGMDELLAGAELEAMEALRPAERVFTTLKLLGHDDDVEEAVQELGIELSADAQTLYDALTARLGAMSEEDWTEFEGLLETYFPTYEEAGAPFVQITMECPGAAPQLLRATFVQSQEGKWLLSQIDEAAE